MNYGTVLLITLYHLGLNHTNIKQYIFLILYMMWKFQKIYSEMEKSLTFWSTPNRG